MRGQVGMGKYLSAGGTHPPPTHLPFCLALLDLCLMTSHRLTLSSGFGPKARIMTDSEGRAAGAKSAGRRGPEGERVLELPLWSHGRPSCRSMKEGGARTMQHAGATGVLSAAWGPFLAMQGPCQEV